MIVNSSVQLSTQKLFTLLFYSQTPQQYLINKTNSLIEKPYLAIIASND